MSGNRPRSPYRPPSHTFYPSLRELEDRARVAQEEVTLAEREERALDNPDISVSQVTDVHRQLALERSASAHSRFRAAIGARNRAAREAIEREIDERRQRAEGNLQTAEEQYSVANELVRSILDDGPSTAQVSPSGELLRAIEERYRPDQQSQRRPTATATSSVNNMSSDPTRDLQRRFSRDPQDRNQEVLPSLSNLSGGPSLPPLRSLGSRRGSAMSGSAGTGGRPSRYRPGERYLERYRNSSENRNHSTGLDDLEHLENENSHLRALLDFTNNPIMSPLHSLESPTHPQDHVEDSRRVKRRKLDSDRSGSGFKGFRYGRYGQVEPGQLTMEIVSCDGGMYSNESSYAAENILKNDNSVYCTKGNRCNIVLRHQGATVFSLKELVIKGPGSNYSSPVREGMVFISMDSDDLLSRTAQYQIQYVQSRGSGRSAAERESRALAPIVSIRHNEDGTTMTRAQVRQRRLLGISMEDTDDDHEYRTAHIPSEFTVAPPPFRVTTECSDDDDDEMMPRPRRRTPNRIGVLPFESDSEDGNPFGSYEYASFEDLAPLPYRRGESLTLAEAAEASQIATQEAVRAVGGELMAPHARFFIEKDKSKCTIRFDPPVSGRFILLKMWSPHPDPTGNIDIQGVIAKGYAGPRYFPSLDLR